MTKTKQQQDIQKTLVKLAKIDPIVYTFAVTAIDKYREGILADEEGTLKAMERSFIAGEAWIRAAKEIEAALQ